MMTRGKRVDRSLVFMVGSICCFGVAMALSRFAPLRDPWALVVWIIMTTVIPAAGIFGTWSYAASEIQKKGLRWQAAIALAMSVGLAVVGVLMLAVRG